MFPALVLTFEAVFGCWGLACSLPFCFGYTTVFQGLSTESYFLLSPFFDVLTCGPFLVVHWLCLCPKHPYKVHSGLSS